MQLFASYNYQSEPGSHVIIISISDSFTYYKLNKFVIAFKNNTHGLYAVMSCKKNQQNVELQWYIPEIHNGYMKVLSRLEFNR